jgi:hypothetical protein
MAVHRRRLYGIKDITTTTLGDLHHRIHPLDEAALRELIDHEHAHGDRTPVLEVLQTRLTRLQDGAEPPPGAPNEAPGAAPPMRESPVRPTTAAEPGTPLRNGVAGQTPARCRIHTCRPRQRARRARRR